MTNSIVLLKKQLIESRTVINELLNKAWETHGVFLGEDEFESFDYIKSARDTLLNIEKILLNG